MTLCDYAGYDYKKEFWDGTNRLYEDICERQTVEALFKEANIKPYVWMDAGCGFGRLFTTYQKFADSFILFDYAQHLLDQAKEMLPNDKPIRFVQGNLMDMQLESECTDVVMSVRTMHHLNKPEDFFAEVKKALRPNGIFIFEIPNQRHLLNMMRFICGRLQGNPFSKAPLQLNTAYFNYHPAYILHLLEEQDFIVEKTVCTSFFRSAFLKRALPTEWLCRADAFLQRWFSWVYLTPSVYVLARKTPEDK
jgi:ubiquinone/menaquinone biosynthesis C-methylase UbiE